MKSKPVLHLRSVRANLARIEKASARIQVKITALAREQESLMVLHRTLEGQLPIPPYGYEVSVAAPVPNPPKQPQVELANDHSAISSCVTSPWPSATPQATDAEQVSGPVRPPEQKAALQSLVGITSFPSRKPGWPLGLSRKLTVCKAWPEYPAHRHRTDGDDVYCVDVPPQGVAQDGPQVASGVLGVSD